MHRLPHVPVGHYNILPGNWESKHPLLSDPISQDALSTPAQRISALESQCEALKEAVRELSWYKHCARKDLTKWGIRDAYRESESQASAVEIKQLRAELSLVQHLWSGTQERLDRSCASIHALARSIGHVPDPERSEIRHALGEVCGAYDSIKEWCKGVRPADTINRGADRQPAHVEETDKTLARYSGMVAAAHAVGVQLKTEVGPYATTRVSEIAYNKGWHEATSYHTRVMLDKQNPAFHTCTAQMHAHHARQAEMYGETWQNERYFGHDTDMKKKACLSFVGHPREGLKNMSEETRHGYFGEVYRSITRDRTYSGYFADGAYPISKESFSAPEDQATWEDGCANRLAGQGGAASSQPVPEAATPVPSAQSAHPRPLAPVTSSRPAQDPAQSQDLVPVTAGALTIASAQPAPAQSPRHPFILELVEIILRVQDFTFLERILRYAADEIMRYHESESRRPPEQDYTRHSRHDDGRQHHRRGSSAYEDEHRYQSPVDDGHRYRGRDSSVYSGRRRRSPVYDDDREYSSDYEHRYSREYSPVDPGHRYRERSPSEGRRHPRRYSPSPVDRRQRRERDRSEERRYSRYSPSPSDYDRRNRARSSERRHSRRYSPSPDRRRHERRNSPDYDDRRRRSPDYEERRHRRRGRSRSYEYSRR
jgi:hypothetical protein